MEQILIHVDILNVVLTEKGFVVLLKSREEDKVLPIFIGEYEARAIIIALSEANPARPLTHDLLKNILNKISYKPVKFEVNDLINDTFYGRISLQHESTSIQIDSRPSDGIALAVRTGIPVYVAKKVMDEAGVIIQEEHKMKKEDIDSNYFTPSEPSLIESLKNKLQNAIEKEEYEKAAKIRDEIKALSSSN